MRHALAAAILLVSSTAFANPKAIEKTVKMSLTNLAKLADNDELGLRSDAIVLDTIGQRIDLASTEQCLSGSVANSFYGCVQASFEHKVGTVLSGTSGDIGWFQVPFTSISTGEDPETNVVHTSKTAVRMGGIITASGKVWTIAAAIYVYPVSDKELFKNAFPVKAVTAPKLIGDKKVAGIVAGWFTSGFAPNAAKKGTLIASGTSASELKSGAAATKLVASWDKLKMYATEIDAKILEGGKVAWVFAKVKLPAKNKKDAAEMNLAAVLLPDGAGGWRWVSLQYQYETNG